MERQLVLGKILANHRCDKELMSKTCEDLKYPSKRNIKEVCRGPAPVDPGNSKSGRRRRGKTCLFINERLD